LRRLLAICCGAALIVLLGCQTTTPTGSPLVASGQGTQGTGISPEQEQLLNKLESKLESLEQRGITLEDALQRMQEQERAASGPPALVKDIWPAQRVISEAISAARTKNGDQTAAALERFSALSGAVTEDLPASQIAVHCERALAYLSQESMLDEAGVEMGEAYRVADQTKFATLVPGGVASLIQTSARQKISEGRPIEAKDVIMTILKKCEEHESLNRMKRIDGAVAGARDALHRGAWAVVEAELEEADSELRDLAETIRPERWNLGAQTGEPATGAATGEAAAPQEGETAATTGQPQEGAGTQQPQAEGQAAAAGTEGAPMETQRVPADQGTAAGGETTATGQGTAAGAAEPAPGQGAQ
jgi:hypothetical protein